MEPQLLPQWVMIIVALAGALGGVTGLVAAIRVMKRDKWEKVETLTASAIKLVNELERRVDKLSGKLDTMENENEQLKCRVLELETENKSLKAETERLGCALLDSEARNREFEVENQELKAEVERLEKRVAELEARRTGG